MRKVKEIILGELAELRNRISELEDQINEPKLPMSWEELNVPKTVSKEMVVLSQLIQLRDAWNGDWKPDWINAKEIKWCIRNVGNTLFNNHYRTLFSVMHFKSEELRDKFFETFRKELETCKELL